MPTAGSTTSSGGGNSLPSLPLATYFSSLGYLSFLLLSTLFFLPRSTSYFFPSPSAPVQRSSVDRPEHPFLNPLTASPLGTMGWEVAGAAVVLVWWGRKLGREWVNAAVVKAPLSALVRTRDTAIATLGTSVLLTFLIIALGAPIHEYIAHTYLLALHLSILLAWPVVYILGIPSIYDAGIFDRYRLSKLLCEMRAENPLERTIVYPVIGTLVGAWLGAFPIPLDWDRPWQSWPLTPTVTSVLGFIIGNYASFAHSALDVLRRDVAEEQKAGAGGAVSVNEKKKKGKKGKTA